MKKKLITIFCVIFSLFLIGSVATSNNKANTDPGKEDTSEVLDPTKENESKKDEVKDETPSVLPEKKEEKADKNTVNQATPSPSTNDSNNNQAPKPSTPPVVKPSNDPQPEPKPQPQKQEQPKQENTKQPTPTPSASPSNEDLIKQLEGEKKVETICIAATTGYPTEEAAYAAAIQEIAAYEATHESSTGSCGAQQHFDDFGHVYWTYWVSYK